MNMPKNAGFLRLPITVVLVLASLAGSWAASAAAGGTVALAPVVVSKSLQKAIDSRYGSDEAGYLQQYVADGIAHELEHAGLGIAEHSNITIAVVIEDALPSHPTDAQLRNGPSIRRIDSMSLGGARLSAELRGADGSVIDRVSLRHYATGLDHVSAAPDVWADAQLAIDSFAHAVAKSCSKHSASQRN
jgi:hypothetical protein